mmetsp:Transcript_91022/g.259868  ORF Transcript_91022/g.259868 Transcript_91022/m.259868 type:complete len:272 (+) Transcript_91022:374-1189(+)
MTKSSCSDARRNTSRSTRSSASISVISQSASLCRTNRFATSESATEVRARPFPWLAEKGACSASGVGGADHKYCRHQPMLIVGGVAGPAAVATSAAAAAAREALRASRRVPRSRTKATLPVPLYGSWRAWSICAMYSRVDSDGAGRVVAVSLPLSASTPSSAWEWASVSATPSACVPLLAPIASLHITSTVALEAVASIAAPHTASSMESMVKELVPLLASARPPPLPPSPPPSPSLRPPTSPFAAGATATAAPPVRLMAALSSSSSATLV